MNLANLSSSELQNINRRVAKGNGEIYELHYRDLDESGERIDKVNRYYIGKMTAGQTGRVLSVLAATFLNGRNLQEAEGRIDGIAFVNALDSENLIVFVSTILGESEEWVDENWDFDWIVDVAVIFFDPKYNPFLDLMKKVMGLAKRMNISEETIRRAAQGS